MDALDFLKAALGDSGLYCVFTPKPFLREGSSRRAMNFFCETREELVDLANEINKSADVFFAVSTYKTDENRKGENTNDIRLFYLDIDVDHGQVRYDSKQEAVQDLRRFCKEVGLPKPVLVDSGGGIHVYWILEEPIPTNQWAEVASKFKQALLEHDIKADPQVTGGIERVMRMPYTTNFRSNKQAKIISPTVNLVSFEDFSSKFGGFDAPVELVSRTYTEEESELVNKLKGNLTGSFDIIKAKTERGEGCAQLDYIMTQQEEISEPLWRAGLSIVKFCDNADELMHQMSENYPDYDPQETKKKLFGIKAPYRCALFEQENPNGCDGCPNKGKIKTPWSLGMRVAEASEEDNFYEDTEDEDDPVKTIPTYPKPYFRGANGGVYIRSQTLVDDEPEERLVYANDIFVTHRIRDYDLGECIILKLILPKDGPIEFQMPLTSVTSREKFREEMSKQGVVLFKMEPLMQYIQKWIEELQSRTNADKSRRQFGWTESQKSFVLGADEITRDKVLINHSTPATAKFFPNFKPAGTFEQWRELAACYEGDDDFCVHQLVMGMALGAPLMEFIPQVHACGMHLFTKDSGFGKSSLVDACLSIWGSPELRVKGDDTINFLFNRAETYKNIPLVIDESGEMDPKAISRLTLVGTDGKQRGRLTSGGNEERARGESWNTIILTTANASLVERISLNKASPMAEAQRVLEWPCTNVNFDQKAIEDGGERGTKFRSLINNHYGFAGPLMVRWVMQNPEKVQKMLIRINEVVHKKFQLSVKNRIWRAGLTVGIAGGMIGNELGLWNYPLENLMKAGQMIVSFNKNRVLSITKSAPEIVTEYVNESIRNIHIVNSKKDLRKNGLHQHSLENLVKTIDPYKVVGRYEPDTEMLYLAVGPFRKWCVENKLNYTEIDTELASQHNAQRKNKRLMAGHTLDIGPVKSIWINAKGFLEINDEEIQQEAERIAADARIEDD